MCGLGPRRLRAHYASLSHCALGPDTGRAPNPTARNDREIPTLTGIPLTHAAGRDLAAMRVHTSRPDLAPPTNTISAGLPAPGPRSRPCGRGRDVCDYSFLIYFYRAPQEVASRAAAAPRTRPRHSSRPFSPSRSKPCTGRSGTEVRLRAAPTTARRSCLSSRAVRSISSPSGVAPPHRSGCSSWYL